MSSFLLPISAVTKLCFRYKSRTLLWPESWNVSGDQSLISRERDRKMDVFYSNISSPYSEELIIVPWPYLPGSEPWAQYTLEIGNVQNSTFAPTMHLQDYAWVSRIQLVLVRLSSLPVLAMTKAEIAKFLTTKTGYFSPSTTLLRAVSH